MTSAKNKKDLEKKGEAKIDVGPLPSSKNDRNSSITKDQVLDKKTKHRARDNA